VCVCMHVCRISPNLWVVERVVVWLMIRLFCLVCLLCIVRIWHGVLCVFGMAYCAYLWCIVRIWHGVLCMFGVGITNDLLFNASDARVVVE
jgi:hypothetical protein